MRAMRASCRGSGRLKNTSTAPRAARTPAEQTHRATHHRSVLLPGSQIVGEQAIDAANDKKDVNAMYFPTANGEQVQQYLSIGPTRWSDFDRQGPAQFFYYLQQAVGNWNATTHTLNIDYDSYRSTRSSAT